MVDPLAGSYYVETLTNQLIEGARSLIKRDRCARRQRKRPSRAVGCRRASATPPMPRSRRSSGAKPFWWAEPAFAEAAGTEVAIPLQRIDARIEVEQVERLRAFRAVSIAAAVAR